MLPQVKEIDAVACWWAR